ncbi:hypothetical protein N864_11275 [Intrasporangium chromatireducens Q5-1]|uniref:DUF3052 domain-containing protein n=1 Tax=Intrasporangium chromatireducens Q5-1 TaxID=584657 RepID=W9GHE4_9MICO|nr:DUF3052 domain-containing protein [Intrasporangium chromatireducens]EWT04582.1 hypothetical protein N864_11275 [Intrasporangium chromatireducens Q5-1]
MTAGAASLGKLGFAKGQVIQEFGYDDDVDDEVRFAIEEVVGSELEDEDFNEGADGVLIWYRDGDEDLGDLLVDGLTNLFDQGFVVLMTPKAGRDGHVEPSEVEEAASTAGLQTGGAVNVSAVWTANRLMPPKGSRR